MEEQFTMHRSRAEEITIAEHIPSTSARFGLEDDFNAMENEFGEMMDLELPRQSPRVTFADESHQSDLLMLPKGDEGADTTLPSTRRLSKDQSRGLNDLGGLDFNNEFGMDDGGLTNFDVLGVDNINISAATEKDQQQPATAAEQNENEVAMEVDQQDEALQAEPEGFVLEPVNVVGTKKRSKKKRKLLVDNVTELSSDVIRANLADPSDTLLPKCFPPPTKKALLWKEAASCEQLFSRPTQPFMAAEVVLLITRNFAHHPPAQPSKNIIDLDPDVEAKRGADTTADTLANDTAMAALPDPDQPNPNATADKDATLMEAPLLDDMQDMAMGGGDMLNMMQEDEQVTRVIPELPDLEEPEQQTQTTEEQEGGEVGSEELERRRWTKRTQQVMRMMDRGLAQQDEINFRSLTRKCSRKQAAARFYTCLLLAKEGAIKVKQDEPYGDIYIQRGIRFTESV